MPDELFALLSRSHSSVTHIRGLTPVDLILHPFFPHCLPWLFPGLPFGLIHVSFSGWARTTERTGRRTVADLFPSRPSLSSHPTGWGSAGHATRGGTRGRNQWIDPSDSLPIPSRSSAQLARHCGEALCTGRTLPPFSHETSPSFASREHAFVLAETTSAIPVWLLSILALPGLVWNQCGRPHTLFAWTINPSRSAAPPSFQILLASFLWATCGSFQSLKSASYATLSICCSIVVRSVLFLFLYGTVGVRSRGAIGSERNYFGTRED
jgi:hypothetical protein